MAREPTKGRRTHAWMALGIDVGGTKTMVALLDRKLQPVAERKFRTRADRGEGKFEDDLALAVERVLEEAHVPPASVLACGIGAAGAVSVKGDRIVDAPNVPFLRAADIAGILDKHRLPQPFYANDCQAALFAEHRAGAGRDARNVIGVFLGTGVGAALILEGKPYMGSGRLAGNLGRFRIDHLAALAGSKRHGYLDDACSRTAIASEAASLALRGYAPALAAEVGTDLADIRSGALRDAIEHGDDAIADLVRSRMRLLGIALANLVDFLNPDLVVLGGGLAEAMPALVCDEVTAALAEHATQQSRDDVRVAISELGDHAVTTGAALLAVQDAMGRKAAAGLDGTGTRRAEVTAG